MELSENRRNYAETSQLAELIDNARTQVARLSKSQCKSLELSLDILESSVFEEGESAKNEKTKRRVGRPKKKVE